MAINSKKKGNRNERKLANLWKVWTGWEFNRTPMSGGLRWKKTDNISGDLVCSEPGIVFKLSIEAKSYKTLDFHNLINGNKCDILKFWDQALSDANRANKIPILFMRYNQMKSDTHYVVIDYTSYKKIKKHIKFSLGRMVLPGKLVIFNSHDLFKSKFNPIYELL